MAPSQMSNRSVENRTTNRYEPPHDTGPDPRKVAGPRVSVLDRDNMKPCDAELRQLLDGVIQIQWIADRSRA